MKRTLIAIAVVAAATVGAMTANAASTIDSSWSTAKEDGTPLAQPIYVRMYRHINKNAYIAMADRTVPLKVDGKAQTLGSDYVVVMNYVAGGVVRQVPFAEVRRFYVMPGTRAGVLTMRDGTTIAVDRGRPLRLPTQACRMVNGQLDVNDCKPAVLAGTLLDLDGTKVIENHAVYLSQAFDDMEVVTGPEAVAKFQDTEGFVADANALASLEPQQKQKVAKR